MSTSTSSSTVPVPPSQILFARGTLALLHSWPVLHLATSESWGGPESHSKRRWFASEIVSLFQDYHHRGQDEALRDEEWIEDFLCQVMSDEFDVVVEDGSANTVAKGLVRLWGMVSSKGGVELELEGAEKEVERLENVAKGMEGKKVEYTKQEGGDETSGSEGEEGDDDDDEAMDEDAPQLIERKKKDEPEVDEDGFTLVKRKR